MTAPNEPGALSKGDGPNADGLVDRGGAHRAATGPGRIPDAGDPPPWQRAATRQSQAGHRQPPPVSHPEGRPTNPPAAADARLNRFISGASAPVTGPAAAVRTPQPDPDASLGCGDGSPAEAYASELPDLSGPTPRAPQRNPAPARPAEGGAGSRGDSAAGSSGGRSITAESRDARVQLSARRSRGPVRASMQIRRIDPWSTLKVSLLLSVALFFVWMITVAFLYLVLGGMGVWAKLNSNVGDLLNNASGSSAELVSSGTIFGGAFLIGFGQHRPDDRACHHRCVRLQPDHRSDRRHRSDAGRPGLMF
ncbi:Possible conserved membrane protein [Mycobacterium tuberculosis]|nr:Possible conserved membrane protein [Mycobacterium tuberculosis]